MPTELINANPTIHAPTAPTGRARRVVDSPWSTDFLYPSGSASGSGSSDEGEEDQETVEPDLADVEAIDQTEVFDLLRSITDPEHPLTLEQLAVVSAPQIAVDDVRSRVHVEFTPTIPHCSMATLIGLSLRVRLLRALPERFKVDIKVKEGSHQSENAVNKQLNDKERVAAALENQHLLEVVQQCLSSAGQRGEVL